MVFLHPAIPKRNRRRAGRKVRKRIELAIARSELEFLANNSEHIKEVDAKFSQIFDILLDNAFLRIARNSVFTKLNTVLMYFFFCI